MVYLVVGILLFIFGVILGMSIVVALQERNEEQ